jgi:hypothetical protein
MTLTLEQIARQALARAYDVTQTVPLSRAPMYRRISVRQGIILLQAAKANPDFYGASATADLIGGAVDLADIADPVPLPATISRVSIADPGTSTWLAGTEINIVPLHDHASSIPPRMTLRDRVLRAVGAELDNVVSLTIAYAREAPSYTARDKDVAVELASPFDELLVIDLAKYLLSKVPAGTSPIGAATLIAANQEETALMTDYLGYVRAFGPLQDRFQGAR